MDEAECALAHAVALEAPLDGGAAALELRRVLRGQALECLPGTPGRMLADNGVVRPRDALEPARAVPDLGLPVQVGRRFAELAELADHALWVALARGLSAEKLAHDALIACPVGSRDALDIAAVPGGQGVCHHERRVIVDLPQPRHLALELLKRVVARAADAQHGVLRPGDGIAHQVGVVLRKGEELGLVALEPVPSQRSPGDVVEQHGALLKPRGLSPAHGYCPIEVVSGSVEPPSMTI